MKLPKMIIFDYSQTLIHDYDIDVFKGMSAVLKCAKSNPRNITAQELTDFSNELYLEVVTLKRNSKLEPHNHQMLNYMFEFLEIDFIESIGEIEEIFEVNAANAKPAPNIESVLKYLSKQGIRMGIISNLMFSGNILSQRINRYLPDHDFEFLIATSEYLYRKPDKRIFELALRKANLEPEEVWYCGDNILCDIEGAINIGIKPILYTGATENTDTSSLNERVIVIKDWVELIKIIQK